MSFHQKPLNLLNQRWIKGLLKNRLYPALFQWAAVVVFALITLETLFGPSAPDENFGSAATWVIWWPLIPLLFFLLGRFWCAICPFGWLSDKVQTLWGANRKVPQFIKTYGLWIIDITFLLITWGDHIWGIVENPRGTGVLLLMITGSVLVIATLFERRTWCRYLCFLGSLSGNYSRAGMLELRADQAICRTCKTKDCFTGTAKVPGCPMFEFPMTMTTNANCNLCANCVKTCTHDSIRLSPRIPTSEFWDMTRTRFEEAFLALVIVGIVLIQNITMLDFYPELLQWIERTTGIHHTNTAFTLLFLAAMAAPVLILFAAAAVSKQFTGDTCRTAFTHFGYAVIPLDLAAHMAHNLFHLLAEGKAVYFTTMGLFGMSMPMGSMRIISDPVIEMMQYTLVILGMLGSLYTVYRIARHRYPNAKLFPVVLPYMTIIALFGIVNYLTFTVRMGMRM
ncbi:MAG: 4Fe-4S binding protein [Solirubrobacterales bacterium]